MLRIYPVVLELVRQVGKIIPELRLRSAELANQCERALISVPLNVAEGSHSRGRNQQARYHTAAGSAREVLACLETAEALGIVASPDADLRALFNRVIGTLVKLAAPRG
ncbi:MAG: four helix bundle protein [Myxococcales bacterium]